MNSKLVPRAQSYPLLLAGKLLLDYIIISNPLDVGEGLTPHSHSREVVREVSNPSSRSRHGAYRYGGTVDQISSL